MKRSYWMIRVFRGIAWAIPGTALLGSSCASDVKGAAVAAGLDFVEDSIGEVLGTLIPVADVLAGVTGT